MTSEPAMNPVGYRWRPIEDLPDNWQMLGTGPAEARQRAFFTRQGKDR